MINNTINNVNNKVFFLTLKLIKYFETKVNNFPNKTTQLQTFGMGCDKELF